MEKELNKPKKKRGCATTEISTTVHDALVDFCAKNGLKIKWVSDRAIEQYLAAQEGGKS